MKPDVDRVRALLSEYIRTELVGSADGSGPRDDDDLLGAGLIDSLGVMSLVYFVEQEFGFDVPAEDVVIEHFLSVATLTRYVSDRLR